jgi:Protein NO VEIN, C-terminal
MSVDTKASLRVEDRAVEFVIRYLERQGYDVKNVSKSKRSNPDCKGFDLLAEKLGAKVKIEVKGCRRQWQIPDLFSTEFDIHRRLVADYLYVVYFLGESEPQLCIIPRDEISPDYVIPKSGYRISGRFKNKRSLEKFMRPSELHAGC